MAGEIFIHGRFLAGILAGCVAADLEGAALPCVDRELAAREGVGRAADDELGAKDLGRSSEEFEAGGLAVGDFEAVFCFRGEVVRGEDCGRLGLIGRELGGVVGAAETGEGEGHARLWWEFTSIFEILAKRVGK